MQGFVAAFTEGPIDFYKSQMQVQIIRSKIDPNYKRECLLPQSPRPPTTVHAMRVSGAGGRYARAGLVVGGGGSGAGDANAK